VLAGARDLTEYRFNSKKNQHYFCRHCGVRAFGVGNDTPVGKMYGVNLGCLDGITEEELSQLDIVRVDGMNDNFGQAPEFSAHL
jgi:hypothetical protein